MRNRCEHRTGRAFKWRLGDLPPWRLGPDINEREIAVLCGSHGSFEAMGVTLCDRCLPYALREATEEGSRMVVVTVKR